MRRRLGGAAGGTDRRTRGEGGEGGDGGDGMYAASSSSMGGGGGRDNTGGRGDTGGGGDTRTAGVVHLSTDAPAMQDFLAMQAGDVVGPAVHVAPGSNP